MLAMRLPVLLLLISCNNNFTSGTQGVAQLSYADSDNPTPIDAPLARGATSTIRVALPGNGANATFTSSLEPSLRVVTASRGPQSGLWFVTIEGLADGKSTLGIGDGSGKNIDTFDFEVATIKSFDIPKMLDANVANTAMFDIVAKDQMGRVLHAPGAVSWSIERDDIARFWDPIRSAPIPQITGTTVRVRGVAPGMTTIHGIYDQTRLDVVVNVH